MIMKYILLIDVGEGDNREKTTIQEKATVTDF